MWGIGRILRDDDDDDDDDDGGDGGDEDDNAEDEVEDEKVDDDDDADVEKEEDDDVEEEDVEEEDRSQGRHPHFWASLRNRNARGDFAKATSYRNLREKMPRPRLSQERRHTLCASLRGRNACQDFTRATLCGNLQGKCRRPAGSHKRDLHFVRACAIDININISQETSEEQLCTEIYRKNAAAQIEPRTQTHTLREPARSTVETHVKISQEPLYAEIYRENAADQSEYPDQALPFTLTVRTPQCGHTVWGKNEQRTKAKVYSENAFGWGVPNATRTLQVINPHQRSTMIQ